MNAHHSANVNIQPTIVVDIHHGDPRVPVGIAHHTRSDSDVFELEVPLVQVEFIFPFVGREINVLQTIIVDVPNSNPATVIKIEIIEYTQLLRVGKLISETDARLRR